MKKLLILLVIFTVTMSGQEKAIDRILITPYDTSHPITIEDWQEWVKVCWADSSESYYYTMNGNYYPCLKGDTIPFYSLLTGEYALCPCHIAHRDPNNFQEFIEWLIRRKK